MGKGYLREALESIPGNELNSPTLATKKLFGRNLVFTPNFGGAPMNRDDELLNTDEPVELIEDEYNPSWQLEARMYPDMVGYALFEMLGPPVTTAGDGIITDPDAIVIPAGATRHVWTAPYGPTGAFPKTFQGDIAYSDPEAVFFKMKGAATQQLEITRGQGHRLMRSGPCLYLDEQPDPSLTAVLEADTIAPFLPAYAALTWLGGGGPVKDFGLTITQELEVEHSYGSGSRWPDAVYKGNAPVQVFGSSPKSLLDIEDFRAMRDVTKFAAKSKYESPSIITGSRRYGLWFDMPNCQYTEGGPESLDNRRRRGATFNWAAKRSGANPSVTITLVNGTASYA